MRAAAAPAANRGLGGRVPPARLSVSGPSAAARPAEAPPALAVPGSAEREAAARAHVQTGYAGFGSSLRLGVTCSASLALLAQARRRSVGGASRRGPRGLRRKAADKLPECITGSVGKRELKRIISDSIREKGIDATVQLLDNMKELGFGWATKAGISLGVEDLCVPETKAPICEGTRQRTLEAELACENGDITVVEKFLKVTGEWTKASEEVKDAAMDNFKANMPTNPVYMMSTSGARGSVSQVRQLIAMRGLMADANGEIIEVPISNSLRDGMTVTDMLISSHGARKGMIDTALRTADSGYLYRRLDFAASPIAIRAEDCGTELAIEHGLDGPFKPTAKLADRIHGRVLASDVLDPETHEVMFERGELLSVAQAKEIENRWKECEKNGMAELPPIRVRSPLTCGLRDGLCSKCYGEDLSTPGKLAKIGTPVGTIAAQSMGEPGTQLTMRTFHTGGAFEGGAGKGIHAASAGTVQLTTEGGEPIVAPSSTADSQAGHWLRTPQGDVACLLAGRARLEVSGQGGPAQVEELERDTLVKVQDGQVVSRGQSLFETNARQMVAALEAQDENADIERLPKPIITRESGEVVITDARTAGNFLKGGSQLVWVLQGSSVSFENEARCSFAVREGDIVSAGMPLATEWALARRAGVQRFQPAGAGRGVAGAGAAGWRSLDWRPEALHGAEDAEAKGEEQSGLDRGDLCLRTDFDWFPLRGAVAEYSASCALPEALMPQEDTLVCWTRNKAAEVKASRAANQAIKSLMAIKPTVVSVYAFSPREKDSGAEEHNNGLSSQGVVIASASRGAEGALCPVSRTAHPQHTVPAGGLVFHLPAGASEEGGRALLWVPEESQTVQVTGDSFQSLLRDYHGQPVDLVNNSSLSVIRDVRMGGCFCVYLPGSRRGFRHIGAPTAVVEEDNGVVRREGHDRLCPRRNEEDEASPVSAALASVTVECVVKPGEVFACPSELLDESWYDDAPAEQGLFFHQKVIPPGVPFIPALPNMTSKQWRVVEILDDPRAGQVCRVLVRHAVLLDVPADPEHELPAETKTLHSWQLPYSHGELVRSQGPVALAYDVVSSVSRHPGERHGATPVPVQSTETLMPPAGLPTRQVAASSEVSGLSLELVRESPSSDICVVQHSPIGTPQPISGDGNWSEPPPKYIAPGQDERSSDAAPTWLPTPRRQLATEGGGCVCSVGSTVGGRSTVVLLGPGDCARVACHSRPTAAVGTLLRRGEALSDSDRAPFAGQVLLVEEAAEGEGGAAFRVTLRRAHPHLVTPGGVIRVRAGSVVQQGDLLGTETLVVPRTSDITQGLPRIAKLFEAAGDALQGRLAELWENSRRTLGDWEAARLARRQLQQEMVSEIQSVYLEQGVFINSRHIEIVAAQMTRKCRVLPGSGLQLEQGTDVDYADVEALLALSPSSKIKVSPRVKGVTQVGKEAHVLVAMGFREIDNIITNAVMKGPDRYPMRGVKENLMMGKTINVGSSSSASCLWSKSDDGEDANMALSEIPEQYDQELLGDLVGNI